MPPLAVSPKFLPLDAGCAPLFLNREKSGIFAGDYTSSACSLFGVWRDMDLDGLTRHVCRPETGSPAIRRLSILYARAKAGRKAVWWWSGESW